MGVLFFGSPIPRWITASPRSRSQRASSFSARVGDSAISVASLLSRMSLLPRASSRTGRRARRPALKQLLVRWHLTRLHVIRVPYAPPLPLRADHPAALSSTLMSSRLYYAAPAVLSQRAQPRPLPSRTECPRHSDAIRLIRPSSTAPGPTSTNARIPALLRQGNTFPSIARAIASGAGCPRLRSVRAGDHPRVHVSDQRHGASHASLPRSTASSHSCLDRRHQFRVRRDRHGQRDRPPCAGRLRQFHRPFHSRLGARDHHLTRAVVVRHLHGFPGLRRRGADPFQRREYPGSELRPCRRDSALPPSSSVRPRLRTSRRPASNVQRAPSRQRRKLAQRVARKQRGHEIRK